MTRSVEIPEAAVEAAAKALRDEGGEPGHSVHSWRCEYPDRYGECDCVETTAREMVAAALPYLVPAGLCTCTPYMEPHPEMPYDEPSLEPDPDCPVHFPAPAVPQPVDREALERELLHTAGSVHRIGGAVWVDCSLNDLVGAVLALLAGEQEQVER